MGYETDIMNGFDVYCREKRSAIAELSNEEQKASQEKVLVARSLLHREAQQMAMIYAEQADSNSDPFWELQEATVAALCAGLEDTSFNKWKVNLTDTVIQVLAAEQMKRLPRLSKAYEKVLDSLDIDFSDIEEELKSVFEPECIYNTLVLLVTAVKNYCEFLLGIYEKQKDGR
ncbi:MAG: hypothetical protein K2L86_16765 [Lachnospiraceae bacterium]|nr:hypothetical protein [Lachnospiraceae bacterium]